MPLLGCGKERDISEKLQNFWKKKKKLHKLHQVIAMVISPQNSAISNDSSSVASETNMSSKKLESNMSMEASDESTEDENILKRVSSLPLVSSVCDLVSSNYTCLKRKSSCLQIVCDGAEKGVKTLTGAAVNRAQPILNTLEVQFATANRYACQGLDTVEEKLPILQQTADQIAFDTKELMSSKVSSAKNAVTRSLSRMVCRTKDAMQGGVKTTTSMVNNSMSMVMGTRMGQIAKNSVEAALVKSHAFVDHYFYIADDDSADLTPYSDSQESASDQPEELKIVDEGYVSCLISLLNKCQRYASLRSQHHLRLANQSFQRVLAKRYQEWKAWLVALYCTITLPLRTIYLITLFTFQELCTKFHESVPQAYYVLEELQTALSTLDCLQDLCRRIFTRVWGKMAEEENLNALLNYVAQNLPFCFFASYCKCRTSTDCTMRALKIIQKMQISKDDFMELKTSSSYVAVAS
ncbi:perilipin-3-like [Tiliqua scincoides]|uniref:perilipin-3-like n=1 Tax=Tiliqua scincoides TaxID=71010 RepID=UPI00346301C5